MIRSSRGFLSLPLGLAIVVLTIAFLSVFGLLRKWRNLVELQLRLDRCVGKTALSIKKDVEAIEETNRRIRLIRGSIAVLTIKPTALPPLRAALQAQVKMQDLRHARWEIRRGRWLLERGCDGKWDIPIPLPAWPWFRPPPDILGPVPLRWSPVTPKALRIRLSHSPRHSAAWVQAREDLDESQKRSWKARWASPD